MKTFKAYFKKEMMESKRQYRYVILGFGIMIFAIAEPVILKLLPQLLKNQIQGDLSSLIKVTPAFAVANYIKDLVNIGLIFVVFSLGGTLSEEISGQRLVFPYSKGSRPGGIVLAKFVHYTLAVTIFIFAGFMIAYYYIGILIAGDMPSFAGVMNSALLMTLYYVFNIALVILISSLVKKGIVAGFAALILGFIDTGLVKIESISKFVPYKLVERANLFTLEGAAATMIFVSVLCMVFLWLAIKRMGRVEVI